MTQNMLEIWQIDIKTLSSDRKLLNHSIEQAKGSPRETLIVLFVKHHRLYLLRGDNISSHQILPLAPSQ